MTTTMTVDRKTKRSVHDPIRDSQCGVDWGDWGDEHDRAAKAEGWAVWDCCGSVYGRWQICKIDDPENGEPLLADDDEAWRIVVLGTKPHHLAAQAFMRENDPKEWQSICHHTARHVRARNVMPELFAEVVAAYMLPDPYGD